MGVAVAPEPVSRYCTGIMYLIDFSSPPKRAFVRGFLKGLAAPVMLFDVEVAPALAPVEVIRAPDRTDAQALAADWRRIGGDLRAVMARHGQTAG